MSVSFTLMTGLFRLCGMGNDVCPTCNLSCSDCEYGLTLCPIARDRVLDFWETDACESARLPEPPKIESSDLLGDDLPF